MPTKIKPETLYRRDYRSICIGEIMKRDNVTETPADGSDEWQKILAEAEKWADQMYGDGQRLPGYLNAFAIRSDVGHAERHRLALAEMEKREKRKDERDAKREAASIAFWVEALEEYRVTDHAHFEELCRRFVDPARNPLLTSSHEQAALLVMNRKAPTFEQCMTDEGRAMARAMHIRMD